MHAEMESRKSGHRNLLPVGRMEAIAGVAGVHMFAEAELIYMGAQKKGYGAAGRRRVAAGGRMMSVKQRKKIEDDELEEEERRGGIEEGKIGKLYLKFVNPERIKRGSAMEKDDLWVLCAAKLFDAQKGGDWASGKAVLVARSESYGASAAGMISLRVLGDMPGSMPRVSKLFAMRGPNIASEKLMLHSLDSIAASPPRIFGAVLRPRSAQSNQAGPEGDSNAVSLRLRGLHKRSLSQGLCEGSYDEWVSSICSDVSEEFGLDDFQRSVMASAEGWLLGKEANPVILVHGVFGSGKTMTLTAVLVFLLRVCVSLPSSRPALTPHVT